MSKEDDAIIQAVTDRLMKAPFMGGNAFHCRLAAKTVIRAYLDGLEKTGWVVTLKTPNDHQLDQVSLKAGIGETSAKEVHAVMIAASPTPPGAG